MQDLFDVNAPPRTADDWRRALNELMASLSTAVGLNFQGTAWFVKDDPPPPIVTRNWVEISAIVSKALTVRASGVLTIARAVEAVTVACDLLLVAGRGRLLAPKNKDLVRLTFDGLHWVNHGGIRDESGLWKAQTEPSRWDL